MRKEHIYTTDGKVKHYSKDEEINIKLGKILGEKFIKYREKWDAVNRFELVTDFPLFLQLDINQNCNMVCSHCIMKTPELINNYYSKETLSWQDYKNIVLEGQEYGCPSISPQGSNEPLLMNDLEKYLKFAHDHGFIDIMINTNAALLTEERAKKLLDAGLTRIRFSIDAITPETYSEIRVGASYYKVVENIERFLTLKRESGYKLPITGVNFCRMSMNEHEQNDFVEYWEDKVDIVTVQVFMPPVFEKDFFDYYPSDYVTMKEKAKDFKCPQPYQRVVIRNFNITPCCAIFSSKLSIGDIKLDNIYTAWNSDKMNHLRILHRNGEYYKNNICERCVNLSYLKKTLK